MSEDCMHCKKFCVPYIYYLKNDIANGDIVMFQHRKNSPLIRIDGDAVQLQRTEYGRCQTDVELHGVRLTVR